MLIRITKYSHSYFIQIILQNYIVLIARMTVLIALKQKKHVYVNTYYKIFTFIFHSNYIALKLYSFSADHFEYCVAIVSLLR